MHIFPYIKQLPLVSSIFKPTFTKFFHPSIPPVDKNSSYYSLVHSTSCLKNLKGFSTPGSQAPGIETLIQVRNRGQGICRWCVAHTLRNASLKHKCQLLSIALKALPWSSPQPALWFISTSYLPMLHAPHKQTRLLSESALLTIFTTWKCRSPQAFLIRNLVRLQMPILSNSCFAYPATNKTDGIVFILLMTHVLSHLY